MFLLNIFKKILQKQNVSPLKIIHSVLLTNTSRKHFLKYHFHVLSCHSLFILNNFVYMLCIFCFCTFIINSRMIFWKRKNQPSYWLVLHSSVLLVQTEMSLVPMVGLEPTWFPAGFWIQCVYQFRHIGILDWFESFLFLYFIFVFFLLDNITIYFFNCLVFFI